MSKHKKYPFSFCPTPIVVIFGAPKYRDIFLSKPSPFSKIYDNGPFQGSMLWSQFSAIFGEKIGVFLKNQCYDQNFA
jgi:hypothetical protein